MFTVRAKVEVDYESLIEAMKEVYREDMQMCRDNFKRLMDMQALSKLPDFRREDAEFDRDIFYAIAKIGNYYYGDNWHSIDDSIFKTEIVSD